MAQLDRMRSRYGETPKTPPLHHRYGESPKTPPSHQHHHHRYGETPKTPPSHHRFADTTPKTSPTTRFPHNLTPKSPSTMATIEQLLRGSGGECYSKWPSNASPTSTAGSCTSPSSKYHDGEEDHTPHHHHRKSSSSVLARVKEKAKKWRRTLSIKKKQNSDGNNTPAWGVSLDDIDDHEEEEEDPEYLGAPMYESELAPEAYKETARQHPRAVHVVSEKHVLVSSLEHPPATPPPPTHSPHKTTPDQNEPPTLNPAPSFATIANAAQETLAPAYATVTNAAHEKLPKAYTTVANAAHEKLPQAYATVTNAAHEKLPQAYATVTNAAHEKLPQAYATVTNAAHEKLAPAYDTVAKATQEVTSKLQELSVSAPSPASQSTGNEHSPSSDQVWDKGVSVKEYLMHKLEPGEDEKALSQMISDAISPRRATGNVSVVEKMREAVNSLLRGDHGSLSDEVASSAPNSPPHVTIATDAHEDAKEENHGRIRQAN